MLNGQEFTVNPYEGCFLFIADWQTFSIPSDVVVVGIENMENFRMIRQQRQLFTQAVGFRRLLFVSRYVTLGASNGKEVQILTGLKAGDRVVTKGAYQVKLASASNAIPAHSHEH